MTTFSCCPDADHNRPTLGWSAPSGGFAVAIPILGEDSVGAVEAPSEELP